MVVITKTNLFLVKISTVDPSLKPISGLFSPIIPLKNEYLLCLKLTSMEDNGICNLRPFLVMMTVLREKPSWLYVFVKRIMFVMGDPRHGGRMAGGWSPVFCVINCFSRLFFLFILQNGERLLVLFLAKTIFWLLTPWILCGFLKMDFFIRYLVIQN